jgi:hypothetical protein
MTCSHLDQIEDVSAPGDGCEECLRIGGTWVNLRQCLTCGFVGCCNDSPGRHMTAHANATTHPIIKAVTPPSAHWSYCYVDDVAWEDE